MCSADNLAVAVTPFPAL